MPPPIPSFTNRRCITRAFSRPRHGARQSRGAASHQFGAGAYDAYDAERPLEEGMVISVETTLQHPQRGFIKLEDTVVVTPKGFEVYGNRIAAGIGPAAKSALRMISATPVSWRRRRLSLPSAACRSEGSGGSPLRGAACRGSRSRHSSQHPRYAGDVDDRRREVG